ncbi:MAG: alanine--tRNA ligase [Clostridium sp.]|nr:alanine--tRNA ligase [Clostridium sp.]
MSETQHKPLTGTEIREAFLKFFAEKHQSTIVKSSSLIPDNPTVLLTTAGMLQFVPYFLGYEECPYDPKRITTCQKCARAGGKDSDIENVGRTPRHHTFFEMLGNFSFGDYYKKEVIPWAWDFVTNYLHLDPNRLYITIYTDDDEAFDIWHNDVGIPAERIFRKGKKDNFWGPVSDVGSCGPCSEIHYDLGEDMKCCDDCSVATCECDRWVEIWNLVFTELFKDKEGNYTPLEKKNVDTGMGLERIAMVVQGKTSTFETDLLTPILDKVCEMTGKKYKQDEKTDISLRIITDHARCVSFMISDGIVPGNEGRNYVLRMIMRRALRHGKMLGLELPFLYNIVDTVVDSYKSAYPELDENRAKIKDVIKKEEEKFKQTLDRGQKLLDDLLCDGSKEISGENAFKLYDTYGFPLELTVEIAQEKGIKVDEEGFKACMKEQKERAKAAAQKIILTDDLIYIDIEKEKGETVFTGYEKTCGEAKVTALVKDAQRINSADEGETVDIILDTTPFYAECGGQVGDTGVIEGKNFKAEVLNTFKVDNLYAHRVEIKEGTLEEGVEVCAQIDTNRRKQVTSHHSATHLLQAALIKVLGNGVKQAGSQVEPDKARFDFSFDRAMTPSEIEQVEEILNSWISRGCVQQTEVMDAEEAKKCGAMALFGEKYGDKVRVVGIKDESGNFISRELCGGTHVKNTSEIRLAKVVQESAISAGSRRIEIVVSDAAYNFLNARAKEAEKLAHLFKSQVSEIGERVDKLIETNKTLTKRTVELQKEIANAKFSTFLSKTQDINGGKLFISKIEDFEPAMVKEFVEKLSDKLGDSVIVVGSVKKDGGVFIMVKVSDSFVQKGINAGKIVGEIASATEGKGGGRPNFAQGAGTNAANLDKVLAIVEQEIKMI